MHCGLVLSGGGRGSRSVVHRLSNGARTSQRARQRDRVMFRRVAEVVPERVKPFPCVWLWLWKSRVQPARLRLVLSVQSRISREVQGQDEQRYAVAVAVAVDDSASSCVSAESIRFNYLPSGLYRLCQPVRLCLPKSPSSGGSPPSFLAPSPPAASIIRNRPPFLALRHPAKHHWRPCTHVDGNNIGRSSGFMAFLSPLRLDVLSHIGLATAKSSFGRTWNVRTCGDRLLAVLLHVQPALLAFEPNQQLSVNTNNLLQHVSSYPLLISRHKWFNQLCGRGSTQSKHPSLSTKSLGETSLEAPVDRRSVV